MLKTGRTKIPVDQEEEWSTMSSKDETRGVNAITLHTLVNWDTPRGLRE